MSGVGRAGAFIVLRSGATARVKLAHLADGFVDDPGAAFPVGKHVRGRVTAVEGSRCAASTARHISLTAEDCISVPTLLWPC